MALSWVFVFLWVVIVSAGVAVVSLRVHESLLRGRIQVVGS